jgi:hypothetical protein
MLRNTFKSILEDAMFPVWEIIKWQLFAQTIMELSKLEMGVEDILMYLPAVIASMHCVLDKKQSNPQLAFHSILATVHNFRGHRFLPYTDPKKGYNCEISPAEDVFYHACMLAFVDDAVQNKFPTKSLNRAYDILSLLMKGGIAYSLYLSFILESDSTACKSFVPSLAKAAVPSGTMFSLFSMWKFPFDHPEKYTKRQLLTYTALMYLVSISAGLLLFYEFNTGNKFEKESAGKYFESFFIAGASLQGLNLVGDFLWEKMSRFTKIPKAPSKMASTAKAVKAMTALSPKPQSQPKQMANPSKPIIPVSSRAQRVSFCQRVGKFAFNVGSMVVAGLTLHNYIKPGR